MNLDIQSGEVLKTNIIPDSDKAIVIINDNYGQLVQQGVISIYDELVEKYGLDTIIVEGAEGSISDMLSFQIYKAKNVEELSKELENQFLSVTEFYAMTSPTPIQVIGGDDIKAHKESSINVGKVQKHIPEFNMQIGDLEQRVLEKRKSIGDPSWIPDNNFFNYDNGKTFENFYWYLGNEISSTVLKSRFPDLENMIRVLKNPYDGSGSAKENTRIAINRILRSNDIVDSVAYIKSLNTRNVPQKALSDMTDALYLIRHIVNFQMTPNDFNLFRSHRTRYSSYNLSHLASIGGVSFDTQFGLLIDRLVTEMEQVYDLTDKRRKNIEDTAINNTGKVSAILAGGFHCDRIFSSLSSQHFSSYLLFPKTDNKAEDKKDYFDRIKKGVTKTKPMKSEGLDLFFEKFETFEDYFVRKSIGRGCYKEAFMLEHKENGDYCTLKIVNVDELSDKAEKFLGKIGYKNNYTQAFLDEGKRGMKISEQKNPHIARLLAWKYYHPYVYFVEEYGAKTLYDLVHEHDKISKDDMLQYSYDLADGINSIHELKLPHGDIHSKNVLFLNGRLFVIDFGMCSSIPDYYHSVYKAPHSEIRAPEQFEGHPIKKTSDIWAWAINTYFISKKKFPFQTGFLGSENAWSLLGEDEREVYRDHVGKMIFNDQVYDTVVKEISADFQPIDKVMIKALQRDPKDRYQDGRALLTDIEKVL